MSYNYDTEFQNAIENTINIGANLDNFTLTDKRYFKQDMTMFSDNIVKTLMWLKDKKKVDNKPEFIPLAFSIIANCGPFHNYMKPIIEKVFNCKSYLTLGYIKLSKVEDKEEKTYHKFEMSDIEESISLNKKFPHNHHIWLTLDSGEILDMTFLMTYRSVDDKEGFYKTVETEGLPLEFINKHYSELTEGMEYKPMYIGEDLLNKAGYNLKLLTNLAVWDSYPENV